MHSASNTSSTRPVRVTPSSVQRTSRLPPGTCTWTSTSRAHRPFSTAATTAAQAPVPQAMVSPEPRSKQRMRSVVRLTTRTNSAFTRSGNSGAFSNFGPMSSRSSASTRSVNTTQCGLPMDTQVTR